MHVVACLMLIYSLDGFEMGALDCGAISNKW